MNRDPSTEEKLASLSCWWEKYNKYFQEWLTAMTEEERKNVIFKISPDMPVQSSISRVSPSLKSQPTDLLVPELNLDAMLSKEGKILMLFLMRRLTSTDLCFQADILLLNTQHKQKVMPLFSIGNLSQMDTPFIDPMDVEENIRSLHDQTLPETRQQVRIF
jgi:hypothetical protein